MKKILLAVALLGVASIAFSQSQINETYSLQNEEKIAIKFEYPSLVKIHTWNKDEVKVNARIDIDGEEGDEKFTIEGSSERGTFYLKSNLTGLSKSNNYHFRSDEEDNVKINENGHTIVIDNDKANYRGVEIDIVVDVYLPANRQVDVKAKFGMVEVLNLPKSLEVDSEFGGIDVTFNTQDIKELDASTSWGQIYSNLDKEVQVHDDGGLGKELRASLNSSGVKSLYLDSKFGNVYLREN